MSQRFQRNLSFSTLMLLAAACSEADTTWLTAGQPAPTPAIERPACAPRCGEQRPSCERLLADVPDEGALALGLLLPDATYPDAGRRALRQAAQLAAEQLNAAGGVPIGSARERRPLQLVVCPDDSPSTAAARLWQEQAVSALISAADSSAVLEVAARQSIEAGALLISSRAEAEGLADLLDSGLVFQLAPSDALRAPVFAALFEELVARHAPERVAVASPLQTLEVAVREALSHAQLGEHDLGDTRNLGERVRFDGYGTLSEARALVERYLASTPQLIVLTGGPESVRDILSPLEAYWPAGAPRPHYLLGDGARQPDLLRLVAETPELAARVHGVGAAVASHLRFARSYELRFGAAEAVSPGLGQTHDAVFALALALAGAQRPPDGYALRDALLALPADAMHEAADMLDLSQWQPGSASPALTGSMTPLAFDVAGSARDATVESWCVGADEAGPRFESSGLRASAGEALAGQYRPCVATGGAPASESGRPAADGGMPGSPAANSGAPGAEEPVVTPVDPAAPPPRAPAMLQPNVGGLALSVQVHVDSFWDKGHCDTVKVTNESGQGLIWSFRMSLDGQLAKTWSCTVDGSQEQPVFRGVDFNRELPPGASAWLGFCVDYDDVP